MDKRFRPTIMQTFDHEWKVLYENECGISVFTTKDVKKLVVFLKAQGVKPKIKFIRKPIPEEAVKSYILPTEWCKDTGYNFNWWRKANTSKDDWEKRMRDAHKDEPA